MLLLIALVAISLGWFLDRRFNLQRQFDQLNREWYGELLSGKASDNIHAATLYREGRPDEFRTYLDTELCLNIHFLWTHKSEIDSATDGDPTALQLANETLQILKCTSPPEYFDFARELWSDTDHNRFPEIFDEDSDAYTSFANFLSMAYDPRHVTSPDG